MNGSTEIRISRRALSMILATVAILAIVAPRAVEAASSQPVKITDPVHGSQKARVTSKGALKSAAEPRLHPNHFDFTSTNLTTELFMILEKTPARPPVIKGLSIFNVGTVDLMVRVRAHAVDGPSCFGPSTGNYTVMTVPIASKQTVSLNLGDGLRPTNPCVSVALTSAPAGTSVGVAISGFIP